MSTTPVPELTDSQLSAANTLFGDRLPLAMTYAEHLVNSGIEHGLLGPREVPRIWSRHILNCAVLSQITPLDAAVADVGSGAGLPGIALALAREDVHVTLIEPMERRVDWLAAVVNVLGISGVTVLRARAEDVRDEIQADMVTARAVSALKKLLPLTAPLMDPQGELCLMKGRSAQEEVEKSNGLLRKLRLGSPSIEQLGSEILEDPTSVVRYRRVVTG